jgi:recombinational DNA repair protein (RecF pathway)
MGYALAFSTCFGCGRPFGFNPHRVPSIDIDGRREPICAYCVGRVNPMRKANGLPEIVPHPDAYEPIEESEL